MDYAEELFNAVEVLLNKKIETVKFDETIVATVIDASKADIGVYTVTTGNAKFVAYSSETVYRENDMVLVTIPQGNYNNQKVIIGKSVDDLNTPMVYKSPFQSIIDVSNNLIQTNKSFSYWANYNNNLIEGRPWDLSISDFKNTDLYNQLQNNYFWQCDFSNAPLKGYNRIGIKAAFSTWLAEYNTVSGTYGLALEIIFCLPDQLDQRWSKIVTLDSSGFFGDIYNFESYYMQEEVFNIEDYIDYPIVGLKIFPYQRNNFKDIDGNPIPTKITDDFSSIGPNIFVRDLYVCVGIPIDGFDTDIAEIYCEQGFIYTKTVSTNEDAAGRDRKNTKNIFLRWIHKNENTDLIKTAQYDDSFLSDYRIFWYRYKLGARSPDGFAGAHWERFFGAASEAGSDGNFSLSQENDEATDSLQIRLTPNVNRDFERIKAIVLKQDDEDVYHVIATSNILEFTNEIKSPDTTTLLEVNALSIKYDDTEKGHYFLYDEAGDIAKNEDKEVRYVIAVFDREIHDVYKKANLQVNECESITWSFPPPGDNTMIIPMTDTGQMATWDETNQCWLGEERDDNNERLRLGQGSNKVGFSIKQHLNNAATSNTIRLEISKEGITYTAQVQPIFGTAGLNGSDYTLVLTWQDGKNAFDISDTDPEYELTGTLDLYDQSGDIVDWPEGVEVKCNWQTAELVTEGTTQIRKAKAQDEEDIFYPVLSNNQSLFYGSSAADSDYQQGDFYYFTSNGESTVYYFDLDSNTFITRVPDFPSQPQPYIQGKKNKLEFQRVTFTTEPLDQETGLVSEHNPPIYMENDNKCYRYSQTQRYIIKYKDRYILDPWNNYQEAETYYEPIEAKECVYEMVQDGTITQTIGGLTASVDSQDERIIHVTSSGTIDMNSLFILEVTLNNFGDYPLVNYYPIALKNSNNSAIRNYIADSSNFIVDYIEGPDRVRYDSSGKVNYNRNPYQITTRIQVNNNLLTYRHGYPNNENYLPGYWRLLLTGSSDDTFSPVLEETAENPESTYDIPILYPASVYIPNNEPYGVQFIYKPDTNPDHNVILWTQPILVYESRYPSRTINKWDGKEILTDKNAGTITASGFSAGKKERDNSFTGVVIGDWSRSVADTAITKNTGIYGFNHGAMAYAFKDDGTGFIGKDGSGRIYFDGGKAQIFSSRWTNHDNPEGMLLDIDDGFIKMQSLSVAFQQITNKKQIKSYFTTLRYPSPSDASKKLYIQSNSTEYTEVSADSLYNEQIHYYKKNGDDFIELTDGNIEYTYFTKKTYGVHEINKLYLVDGDINSEVSATATYNDSATYYLSTGDGNKYITIGSNQTYYPLSIGTEPSVAQRGFKVKWDGTTYINDGVFTGEINAIGGSIKGDFQVQGTLQGGTISGANISGASIEGGWITGGSISGGSISGATISSGSARISNGTISGATITGASVTANYLQANNGEIGGWTISENGLTSRNDDGTAGKTTLHKTNGITTNTITISDTNASGQVGYVPGLDSGGQNTAAFGIKSTTHSIILQSGNNVALKAPNDAFIQGGYGYGTNGNVAVSTISAKYTPDDNTKPGIELITSERYGVLIQAPRVDIGTSNSTTQLYINGNEFNGSSYAKFAPDSMNNNSGS